MVGVVAARVALVAVEPAEVNVEVATKVWVVATKVAKEMVGVAEGTKETVGTVVAQVMAVEVSSVEVGMPGGTMAMVRLVVGLMEAAMGRLMAAGVVGPDVFQWMEMQC